MRDLEANTVTDHDCFKYHACGICGATLHGVWLEAAPVSAGRDGVNQRVLEYALGGLEEALSLLGDKCWCGDDTQCPKHVIADVLDTLVARKLPGERRSSPSQP